MKTKLYRRLFFGLGFPFLIIFNFGCQEAIQNQKPSKSETVLESSKPEIALGVSTAPAVKEKDSVAKPTTPIKHAIKILPVPFTVQAPYANWGLPYQEACEEASMIMAAEYFKGNKNLRLTPSEADQAILKLVDWEKQTLGFYEDTTATEVALIIKEYFDLAATVEIYKADLVRAAIDAGNLVLVPAAGRELGNPYFRQPGPLYHMLVIKGYQGDEFITNDPGTKRGESYRYMERVIAQAVHDWNSGKVASGEPVIIIVSKPDNR